MMRGGSGFSRPFRLTLYDPDPRRCRATADMLRRELGRHVFRDLRGGVVSANVTEVACYLAIARQGYADSVPVLELDGVPLSRCLVLEPPHVRSFAAWLEQQAQKEDRGGSQPPYLQHCGGRFPDRSQESELIFPEDKP
ncbi:hypothetical protein [Oleidesulfovibrio alaskensis]|jgi:hypothetical protein|nr:hypothetical protein [Oleidesulfovibrio alaskensis]MBG0772552.1 hypothetical protein [Oleidesulfovibrio alaskensis]MBL3583058.1 hypothetical protein [Oleidesulfovibrio alaskensis]